MPGWIAWGVLVVLVLCVAGVIFGEKITSWINKYILKGGGKFRW